MEPELKPEFIERMKKNMKQKRIHIGTIESSHSTSVFTGGEATSSIRESKYSAPTTNERPDRREHATGLLASGGREYFDNFKKMLGMKE